MYFHGLLTSINSSICRETNVEENKAYYRIRLHVDCMDTHGTNIPRYRHMLLYLSYKLHELGGKVHVINYVLGTYDY